MDLSCGDLSSFEGLAGVVVGGLAGPKKGTFDASVFLFSFMFGVGSLL